MTNQSCQQTCRRRQLPKAVFFFVALVLVTVVYLLVKVSGTVIVDVVMLAFTIMTTSVSEL